MSDNEEVKCVHVLTFFMAGQVLQTLEESKEFKKFKFYPLILNNELSQYHILQSDKRSWADYESGKLK